MTTDKSKSLTTSISLLNEKLHFEGRVDGMNRHQQTTLPRLVKTTDSVSFDTTS